ncbi:MAG: nuclear transport factor 2 family protein [Rhodobacter sp.]|nr:nuclear transport factor 2 family protein [Paracoccaceae bacterium]MCC0077035.1 nuclear transport factor 2 family protein [Rhodobacter sp.]
MQDRTARQRVLDDYFAAHNAGRIEAVLACYAADARLEEVASGASRQGCDALRRGLEGFLALFRGAHFDCGPRIVAGDSIVCPYTLSAEVARDLGPLRLAGRRIRLPGVQVMTFDGEAIALVRDFWDFDALAAQARPAEPQPASEP